MSNTEMVGIWFLRIIGLYTIFSLLLFAIFGFSIIKDISSPDREPSDLLKGFDLIKEFLLSQVSGVSIFLSIITNILIEFLRLKGSKPSL